MHIRMEVLPKIVNVYFFLLAFKILTTKKLSSIAFFRLPFMTAMFYEIILVEVFLG